MTEFDSGNVLYAYQDLQQDDGLQENPVHIPHNALEDFKKFFVEWQSGGQRVYMQKMTHAHEQRSKSFEMDLGDLQTYNESYCQLLIGKPNEYLPLLERAASEAFFQTTNQIESFQVLLVSEQNPKNLRDIKASSIGKLITVAGIITQATRPYIRSQLIHVECSKCHHVKQLEVSQGLGSVSIPPFCLRKTGNGAERCPKDCYVIIPEKCKLIDQQRMKLQETPESIPTGEIPRTFSLCAERFLVNRLAPGTRVVLTGIYQVLEKTYISNLTLAGVNQKVNYIQVVGYMLEDEVRKKANNFSADEEQAFKAMAKDPQIFDKIAQSVAPAIFGSDDIKKAIACLLFSGSKKTLSDGIKLRGDINVLLIGDPSTGKSQFLKFVQRIAPNAVYTSGKGSSASGLTASVTKDPSTGEFQIEGGAMVLADGGVVCIDEFDKMRAEDRVAIHEAMEQQTISIAKAGITTRLNSRCSVLAAANPIFGSYNDMKSVEDQIELQTTILSRFDCIFIVRDPKTKEHDLKLAEHVLNLHMHNGDQRPTQQKGEMEDESSASEQQPEIEQMLLRKYIAYARARIHPRLTESSAIKIQNLYVKDREKSAADTKFKKHHIPITVRQLEAIIRLSESIAKLSLCEDVEEVHINQAHQLFQDSTMNAISNGKELGIEPPQELMQLCFKIEEAIRRRVAIDSKVDSFKLKEEMATRWNNVRAVDYAILKMIKTGEFQQLEGQRVLLRKK